MELDTQAVHAGAERGSRQPLAPVIEQTSVYIYEELEDYDAVAAGRAAGHVYARNSNRTVAALERAVAALEGAGGAAAVGSGTAAILVAIRALAPEPGLVLAPPDLYGGTWVLFRRELEPLGYRFQTVDLRDLDSVAAALPDARLLLAETVSNPLCRVVDLAALAAAARRHQVPLLVDGTFATPVFCRPLALGATAVVHSATKYLGGHSDLIAGVVAGDERFAAAARQSAARLGTTLGPFEAWLVLRGLRTLHLRMRRHSENAHTLAQALEGAPGIDRVHHPGLPGHPDHELAARLLPDGAGGMLAIDLTGGREAVQRLMERLRLVVFAASLGGVETTISHPEVTSHRYLEPAERAQLGIGPGTLRISAGIEAPADIVADFLGALS